MSAPATVKCAEWSRQVGLDPIATIGSYRAYLLVEWPLPWPSDLSEVGDLGVLGPALAAASCRLQAVVARGDTPARRVALYWSKSPEFTSYHYLEKLVPAAEMGNTAVALLEAFSGSDIEPSASDAREVLVCTHGRRDRCCGSLGTDLALTLLADPDRLGGVGTRVGRTSHTGGHRFAPTALVFPDGTAWAFADADLLDRVVNRRGPLEDVLPRYRGCAGLGSRRVQVLERAVLAEMGWELFDLARRGEDVGDDAARLTVRWPDGSTAEWEARVEAGRTLPVPDCGSPLADARKSETELVVHDLRRAH